MKRIFFPIISGVALLMFLGGCEKFNDQFDGLDDAAKPTNVIYNTYKLLDADYSTISKNALLVSLNAADSAIAKGIATNKYFSKAVPPDNYVPSFLATKYKYADEGSVTVVTYNAECDTTALTSKYTLKTADYNTMKVSTLTGGSYFNTANSPTYFIPVWLKQNFPYAKVGDTWLIRYKFYVSSTSTVNRWLVSIFDGTNWSNGGNITSAVAKFVVKNGAWKFVNSDILVGLNSTLGGTSSLGDFNLVSLVGDQVWKWDASYKYMTITGYVSTGVYADNDDWLISPAMNLTERGDSTFLTFSHTGKYFSDAIGSITNLKKECSVWVSTTSDGTAANFNKDQWTQIEMPDSYYPTGQNWTFVNAGPIKLGAYKGKDNVRIAFRYYSLSSDGYAGTYEIKNIYVYEKE